MKFGQRDVVAPLEIFLWSRVAIWLTALLAFTLFEPNRSPLANRWDGPELHDLGWAVDVWARWDSSWFLRIAEHGYSDPSFTPAFAPVYPWLVGGLGRVLGAVYSESLYLALSVGVFLLAERGRLLGAAGLAGLAGLTRIAGVALLPALAVFAWRSPNRLRAFASLAVAPLLWLVYPLVLWLQIDEPLGFLDAQREGWERELSPFGPLAGIWEGAAAGWHGALEIVGAGGSYYAGFADTTPLRAAGLDLQQLVFLVLFVALAVVAWRRLGAAYGLYAAASLALPLASPAGDYPLLSLPRFGLAIFPLFLALATLGARPRVHVAIVAASAMLLGLATAQWALWQWVA